MTASERAKFKRIDQRRDRLFKALLEIGTWLSFVDPYRALDNIDKIITKRVLSEQRAARKEEMRELKGGAK